MEKSKTVGDVSEKKSLFTGISKNVVILGITSFLTDFSTELYYPLLPVFLTAILKTGASFVGLIEGIAESTASLLKLVSGWLSDRLNRRKALVILGYGLSGLTRPFIAIATMGWHVLGARFVDRIGKGFRTAPRDALIADSTHPDYRGKAFGFHRAMDHAGAVVGPLVAFSLIAIIVFGSGIFTDLIRDPLDTFALIADKGKNLAEQTYRSIFWVATIPAILAVLVLALFVKDIRRAEGQVTSLPALTLKPFDRYFKVFLLIIILFTLGNSSDAFLVLRAQNLGLLFRIDSLEFQSDLDNEIVSEGLRKEFENKGILLSKDAKVSVQKTGKKWKIDDKDNYLVRKKRDGLNIDKPGVATVFIPILWAVLHVVKMLSSTPGGAWSDRVGRRKTIITGWGIYGLIYLGFAFARYEWHVWSLFALYGIYFGLTEGSEKAFVADIVPSELRGTAYGIYNFAIGIAALPSSLFMGLLWDMFNATVAFIFGASLALIAMVLLLLTIPARLPREKT